jgi:hypothetical protein
MLNDAKLTMIEYKLERLNKNDDFYRKVLVEDKLHEDLMSVFNKFIPVETNFKITFKKDIITVIIEESGGLSEIDLPKYLKLYDSYTMERVKNITALGGRFSLEKSKKSLSDNVHFKKEEQIIPDQQQHVDDNKIPDFFKCLVVLLFANKKFKACFQDAKLYLEFYEGSVTTEKVATIVHPTDSRLSLKSEIGEAINQLGGHAIRGKLKTRGLSVLQETRVRNLTG